MKWLRQHATVKSIAGVVLLLMILSVIVGIIGYRSFTNALLDMYEEGAFLTAESAAEFVDVDRIDEYIQSGGTSPEYLEVWNKLDILCNRTEAAFIYVIQADRSDYAHITFIFSTIDHGSTYTLYDFGYVRRTTSDEYKEKYRALYEQKSDKELVILDRGRSDTGSHLTAMIGLKGADGQVKAVLCVQRQMDILRKERNTYLNKVAATVIGLVLVVIVSLSFYLHRMLLRPVTLISKEATRFSSENTVNPQKLRDAIPNIDEIGQLASSIDRMEEQVESYISDITHITAEREHISTELNLAARIQKDFVPHTFPPFPERTEFDIYASMEPAKTVGGDFYDYFFVDDDHLCLVMADVSGKGIPASLFMMASKIILQSCAMLVQSPAEILTNANEAICNNNQEGMFVTVWLGILEISTGKLVASNAGHEYPVLKDANGDFVTLKEKHDFVVGGMSDRQYREYELQLTPGSKLFVYTDGVPEATDVNDELFGMERMLKALNEEPEATPETILRNVRRAVDDFVQEAEQFDDLTMLCLEYHGPDQKQPVKELTLDATVENWVQVLAFVDRELDTLGCSRKARMKIDVALEEAFVNIAHYAYTPGTGQATIRVETEQEPKTVKITLIDRGTPYDPLSNPDPDVSLSAEERSIGGLGIFMAKKNVDEMHYERRDGQNVLTLKKNL